MAPFYYAGPNYRPTMTKEQRRLQQEATLSQNLATFLPQSVEKFLKDTQDINGLNQPPFLKLVSKQGETACVPRNLLKARSPAVKRIKWANPQDHVLQVPASTKGLNIFVEYLETGNLNAEWNNIKIVLDLCTLAIIFELKMLYQFLDENLVNFCDYRNLSPAFLMKRVTKLNMPISRKKILLWLMEELDHQEFIKERRNRRIEMREAELRRWYDSNRAT